MYPGNVPAIAVGATAGAAAGAWLAKVLIHANVFSTYSLLLAAAVALGGSLALLRFAESRQPAPAATHPPAPVAESRSRGAFRLVLSHRYLLAVAVVILIANWVKTNSDNLLFAIVQEVVATEAGTHGITNAAALERFTADQTTSYYGDFFFWVNVGALVLQALAASRLLKYGGFRMIFLALPLFSLLAYPLVALIPTLFLFRLAKIGEESLSYSLHNTALQVLWLPTTREMKFKGKAAIDTLFVRIGDGLAAFTTFLAVQIFALPVREFFVLNALLALAWAGAAFVVVREHAALSNLQPVRARSR